MAEFCLDCWNKINGTKDSRWRYVLSWEKDYCEECGKRKRVIIVERLWSSIQRSVTEAIERVNNSENGENSSY